mmetsp:Transcript_52615/g.139743  ORF Transcript_52615/g.139743 Transcript_52615/m.139743 type:complete len:230 (-) Transcript_52615:112-801(-)
MPGLVMVHGPDGVSFREASASIVHNILRSGGTPQARTSVSAPPTPSGMASLAVYDDLGPHIDMDGPDAFPDAQTADAKVLHLGKMLEALRIKIRYDWAEGAKLATQPVGNAGRIAVYLETEEDGPLSISYHQRGAKWLLRVRGHDDELLNWWTARLKKWCAATEADKADREKLADKHTCGRAYVNPTVPLDYELRKGAPEGPAQAGDEGTEEPKLKEDAAEALDPAWDA